MKRLRNAWPVLSVLFGYPEDATGCKTVVRAPSLSPCETRTFRDGVNPYAAGG